MATRKIKKRKFSHPDMLGEESSSNDSTSSNHNILSRPTFILGEETSSSNESDYQNVSISSPKNKKRKKIHSDVLGESSNSSETNSVGQHDEIGVTSDEIVGPSDRPSLSVAIVAENPEPIAGPSHLPQPQQLIVDNSSFFEEETKVFENDYFSVFIQKQDHQRQKVFRLEDHLYVMRVKLKNHRNPPLLTSIRNIIEETMTIMVNDLKNHYNPEESNLIYITSEII